VSNRGGTASHGSGFETGDYIYAQPVVPVSARRSHEWRHSWLFSFEFSRIWGESLRLDLTARAPGGYFNGNMCE